MPPSSLPGFFVVCGPCGEYHSSILFICKTSNVYFEGSHRGQDVVWMAITLSPPWLIRFAPSLKWALLHLSLLFPFSFPFPAFSFSFFLSFSLLSFLSCLIPLPPFILEFSFWSWSSFSLLSLPFFLEEKKNLSFVPPAVCWLLATRLEFELVVDDRTCGGLWLIQG